MKIIAQIEFFRALAKENYNTPGWDVFTEAYDEKDIRDFLARMLMPTCQDIIDAMTERASCNADAWTDGAQYREDASETLEGFDAIDAEEAEAEREEEEREEERAAKAEFDHEGYVAFDRSGDDD